MADPIKTVPEAGVPPSARASGLRHCEEEGALVGSVGQVEIRTSHGKAFSCKYSHSDRTCL